MSKLDKSTVPTLGDFEFYCMFQEAWDPANFHLAVAAWWTTYHEFTM